MFVCCYYLLPLFFPLENHPKWYGRRGDGNKANYKGLSDINDDERHVGHDEAH